MSKYTSENYSTEKAKLMPSKLKSLFFAAFMCSIAAASNAQTFIAPQEIVHSGKVYKLAFKSERSNGRATYEYTTNAEPIEKWTTLVTLNYAKGVGGTLMQRVASLKKTMDAEKPVPHYSIYIKGGSGYVRIIYEPDARNPVYESNVHKNFDIADCDGKVIYQFAVKYPPSVDQSDAGKLATLRSIYSENQVFSEAMEKSDWLPTCKAAE